MDKFIIKTFGINKLNFWGWIAAGFCIIAGCIVVGVIILKHMLQNGMDVHLCALLGILFVLFGQFCLSLQKYCSKLAEKLEQKNK